MCERCRGLVVGWNWKYLVHQLICLRKLSESFSVSAWAVGLALVMFILPAASAVALYDPAAAGDRARMAADLARRALGDLEQTSAARGTDSAGMRPADPGKVRIVVDAGHGGRDVGGVGPSGLTEKDLALDIAERLRGHIETELDAQVVLTRNDDVYVPLRTRTEIANRANADLFISIHVNASQRESSRGFETYFRGSIRGRNPEGAGASREFATHVQDALAALLPPDENRGVKSARLAVLKGARMPSVLAEVSFISNPEDELLLGREDHREQIARALSDGVRSYVRTLRNEPGSGATD